MQKSSVVFSFALSLSLSLCFIQCSLISLVWVDMQYTNAIFSSIIIDRFYCCVDASILLFFLNTMYRVVMFGVTDYGIPPLVKAAQSENNN